MHTVKNVSSLATDMLSMDYVSNPTTWIASNLASIADALGGTVGLTGNTVHDLNNIKTYIDGRLEGDWAAVRDIGPLDTAAIAQGTASAITTLLTYATASMLTKDGRMTTMATNSAKEITESFITGGPSHAGKLQALISSNETRMAEIIDSDLNVALSDMNSPTWQRYSSVKRAVVEGWTPVTNNMDGNKLSNKLKRLATSDPAAYAKSIKPIYYSKRFKRNIMLFHTINQDGSISFDSKRVQ